MMTEQKPLDRSVVVPLEPTDLMFRAADRDLEQVGAHVSIWKMRIIWAAMAKAAQREREIGGE